MQFNCLSKYLYMILTICTRRLIICRCLAIKPIDLAGVNAMSTLNCQCIRVKYGVVTYFYLHSRSEIILTWPADFILNLARMRTLEIIFFRIVINSGNRAVLLNVGWEIFNILGVNFNIIELRYQSEVFVKF